MTFKKQTVAFITGITGQDGSYLAELLLEKGYTVHGMIRYSSFFNTGRINHIYKHKHLHLHYGDMTDGTVLHTLIAKIQPDEVYNLAAQSHVKISFETPEYTGQVDAMGAQRLLDAVVANNLANKCRFYQASTSELYGNARETPQSEETFFCPRSPYAIAKLYAHWMTVNYREAHGLFACNGILFNHESPRRGSTFVTQKIVRAAVRIKHGGKDVLRLGNVNARRDWGHAKDYVRGMWMILQHTIPQDWVLATGEQHTVKEFCNLVFGLLGFELAWEGEGAGEFAYDKARTKTTGTLKKLIVVDETHFRPTEVGSLVGDASKARRELNWKPSYTFAELVEEMVREEIEAVKNGKDVWS